MNTLLWFIAMIASGVLAYFSWVVQSGTSWELIGWMSIALALFCVAAGIGAFVDEVRSARGES